MDSSKHAKECWEGSVDFADESAHQQTKYGGETLSGH